ncbi:MAG TPA: serine/threonine-protein kinase [Polyangiaceae bacterium]
MDVTEAEQPRGMGAFRILRRLPASSREVFLARAEDGHEVVLKVFGAPQRNQGLFDPKIADEASAYARLAHANIVKVVDMFSADGQFVIALEYVDGAPLSYVRAALERIGRAVPDACWLYVMHGVFAALAEAHGAKDPQGKSAPVIHRGVNPSNVLLAWDGAVKLGNFNIAQSVRVLRDSNPGVTWGSYGYFAPEQVRLETPSTYSDVYSATLVLWELLAGRKGIERQSLPDVELLKAMATPNLTPLEKIRHDLTAPVRYAVRAGLESDPKRRYVDAARIRDVLRAAVNTDAARAELVELLAAVKATQPEPSVAPPPPEVSPAAEAPISITSLAPDPDPEAPPPPPMPPPPLPALEPIAPEPPATPNAIVLDFAREPEPAPPISKRRVAGRRARGLLVLTIGMWIAAACVFGAAIFVRTHAHAASAPLKLAPTASTIAPGTPVAAVATTSTVAAAPTEPPATTAEPPPAPEITSRRGRIVFPAWAKEHRVYVDHHVAGDGSKPLDLACGAHVVRIGSHGKTQSVDVPCGGDVSVE